MREAAVDRSIRGRRWEHPRAVPALAKPLQDRERLAAERHAVREAVLGELGRDRPPRAVHVLPAHRQNLTAALGGHKHQPEGVSDDSRLGVAASPRGPDLVLGQDAVSLRLGLGFDRPTQGLVSTKSLPIAQL
jgi:hypothetical protein